MLLKCERCGAPLEVPAGGSVRCSYCGTTATAPAPPPPPPGPGYGHVPIPYPVRHQPPPQAVKRAHWGGLLGLLFPLIAVAFSVGASFISRTKAEETIAKVNQAVAISAAAIGWSTADPGCLIDANGDGVSDIAGLTGASDLNQPTVVDGKTGALLFTGTAVKKAEQLGCLGPNAFFVVEGNFQVDFFTARSPWGKTSVMARDKVSEYGVGQGCVQLKTDDGTVQGIQLPSGVATTCPATLRRYYGYDEPGVIGLTDHATELVAGARKYKMSKRESGTEILTVRVSEGPREVWTKELPYASCTFGSAIAVAPGKIMIWAAQPGERDKGLIIGLDEATGSQLYEIKVTDSSSDNPSFFKYNDKYVLAVSWGALRAYDPANGNEVWRVGR